MAEKIFYKKELTQEIIACAIEVHRNLGPGLLESAYEECMCYEFGMRGLPYDRQRSLPLAYKGVKLDCGYRMDLVVGDSVILELKCVENILPVHEAQLLTYLRLSKIKVGLIINFYSKVLTEGIRRIVL